MRQPKEPKTFKYPRMYATFSVNHRQYCRLRIIEPNGKSCWFNGYNGRYQGRPCWAWYRKFKNGLEEVKALKKYCSENLLSCVYIGEIK